MRYKLLITIIALFLISSCSTNITIPTKYSGIVAQSGSNELLVFNPEDNNPRGTITLPSTIQRGITPRVAIYPLGLLGLVAESSNVHSIQINDDNVSLRNQNLVDMPHTAATLATAQNSPFLLVGGKNLAENTNGHYGGISIVEPIMMNTLSTLLLPGGMVSSIAICDDRKTLLVGSLFPSQVRRLTVSSNNKLEYTHQILNLDFEPSSIACSAGSASGVVLGRHDADILSFSIDGSRGLTSVDHRNSVASRGDSAGALTGHTLLFNPNSSKLFVRTSTAAGNPQLGWVERFSFDPATGTLGAESDMELPVSYLNTRTPGITTISIHPDGTRLYVPSEREGLIPGGIDGRVEVYNTETGHLLHTISHPSVLAPSVIHVGGSKPPQ